MATGYLLPIGPLFQAFSDQGVVGSGYKINTYVGGTVSTPVTTYTDSTLVTPNSNPILIGSNGRFQSVNCWVPSGTLVKIVLTDANNNVLTGGTIDNVPGINDTAYITQSYIGQLFYPQTTLEISNSVTPTYYYYPPGNPLRYGAVGDGSTDDTTAMSKTFSCMPAYGVIDLQQKTYMISAATPRPNVGVMVRNGKIYLNAPSSFQIYALVANDYCVFDDIYILGTGAVGTSTTVTFTGSVGGAASGTLSASITNGSYVFTFSDAETRYVTVTGGTAVTWTGNLSAGSITTATYPTTARYQGGIFSGNTSYSSPMNTAPANYVSVRNCTFDNLTVGVWAGGAAVDATPIGWKVTNNTFKNIVGVPSLSEGYGCLFTPASDGVISGNVFETIRRHAIYLASNASNNVVSGNVVNGIDNIAIQCNTSVAQSDCTSNVISNNELRGFTKSVAYGYRSSVGIGLYGRNINNSVIGNQIFGALDTGIDTSGELSGSSYSDNLNISGNHIDMDATASDAGIRIDGLQSGNITNNYIRLKGAYYGVIFTSTYSAASTLINFTSNTIDTTNATAIAVRIALSANRYLQIFRNILNGFPLGTYAQIVADTSSAGTRRTDLNGYVGYYATDADFTHYNGGTTAATDCPRIRHAATLTAARTITLDKTTQPLIGAAVTIMRTGAGAFNLNVSDGGTIKALTTGTWASFGYNGTTWEETGFGNL